MLSRRIAQVWQHTSIGSALLLVAIVGISITFLSVKYFPDFNRPGKRVSFSLQNQNSEQVSAESLRGQWLMVYFGFTHCPDVCPAELAVMTTTLREIEKLGHAESIVSVFITVDPVRDTSQRLKNYLAHFHGRFIGLTGSAAEIANATASFNVYYRVAGPSSAGENYSVDHSSIVYLVDPNGYIAGHFPYGQRTKSRVKIINRLLSNPDKS